MAEIWKVVLIKGSVCEHFCCYFSMTRNILSDEDKAAENAKWGLGIAAVVGKLMWCI